MLHLYDRLKCNIGKSTSGLGLLWASGFWHIYIHKPEVCITMQADILLWVTNQQPILQLVNLCITFQKKWCLHKLFSSWPGDAHNISWKAHKSVCFVFSYVVLLMQSLKQGVARKTFLQSILPLHNFERFTNERVCNVLQTVPFQLCMFNKSTSYHS